MRLAHRLKIEESQTVRMNDLAQTKSDLINFSAGDLKLRSLGYPPVAGLPELRQEAIKWMNRRYDGSFNLKEVVVTPGGKFALYAVLNCVLNPGDEVIVPSPYWVSYIPMVQLCSGSVKIAKTNDQWKITPEILEKSVSAKTKVLIFNNATNPTGVLYTVDEVKAILSWAKSRECLVLSDEVYSEITFDDHKFISCALFKEHKDHVVIVESCSKNFALAGLRIGFAFGPEALISEVIKLKSQSTTGTSVISQMMALEALKNADNIIPDIRMHMQKRRDLFVSTYQTLFGEPLQKAMSGIYQFVPVKQKSEEYCLKALEKGVALVPGIAFGVEGFVRFAFCEDENTIVEGLRRLV